MSVQIKYLNIDLCITVYFDMRQEFIYHKKKNKSNIKKLNLDILLLFNVLKSTFEISIQELKFLNRI